MSKNYSYIYETAQYEQFERSILGGYLTKKTILEMIDRNELDSRQIAIAEGLFGDLKARATGAFGAGKAALSNAGQVAGAGMNAITKGQQPGKMQLQDPRQAYKTGAGNSLINGYNKKLTDTLNSYVASMRKLNVSSPEIEEIISGLTQQLSQISMAQPPSNANAGNATFSGNTNTGGAQQFNASRTGKTMRPATGNTMTA